MTKQVNLTDNLNKLNEIASWFDQQSHADVEEGLAKVKEAAVLIKESKQRLSQIENEFIEIQSEIAEVMEDSKESDNLTEVVITRSEVVSSEDSDSSGIPF